MAQSVGRGKSLHFHDHGTRRDGLSAARPGRTLPGKGPVHIVQEARWAPGSVWTGAENLAPPVFDPRTVQAVAQSLYRLSYPAQCKVTYTGCNRRNGPDFGRVFLRSNYTDITQNTYIQS